jgi:hypothetical protein
MVIFVAGACGSGGGRSTKVIPKSKNPSVGASAEIVLKSRNPVVALAIQASDIAWLESEGGDAGLFSLWLRASGKTERLPWPSSPDDFGDNLSSAEIGLTRGEVGWYVDTYWGNNGETVIGSSSLHPRRMGLLTTESTGDAGSAVGKLLTGFAVTSDSVLWATTNVALKWGTLEDDDSECDLDPTQDKGCETRISDGVIHSSKGGISAPLHGLSPVEAIAADGNLVALATWPKGPFVHGGYPPLGPVVVGKLGGPTIARIDLPEDVRQDPLDVELALSRQLLAVRWGENIFLYDLHRGRLLRIISSRAEGIVVTDKRLMLYDTRRLVAVDPANGHRTTIATSTARSDVPGITAVAADGDRLAWALTDSHGHSVVKMMRVD